MRVICIRKSKDLTVGKIYDILEENTTFKDHDHVIRYFIDDVGTELLYSEDDKDLIPLEQWRDQQLNKIGI